MSGQVIFTNFFAQPFLKHGTVYIVVIRPAFISRIIWRINVDALHFSGILGKQGFQGKKVIPFDDEVTIRLFRLVVEFFNLVQCMIRDGKVVIPDDVFALELQSRH